MEALFLLALLFVPSWCDMIFERAEISRVLAETGPFETSDDEAACKVWTLRNSEFSINLGSPRIISSY